MAAGSLPRSGGGDAPGVWCYRELQRDSMPANLAHRVRRIGHLDLPGAGQVCVADGHAYVGHIPSPSQLGTSIIDVSDPKHPRVASTITLDDPTSHSHKARAV